MHNRRIVALVGLAVSISAGCVMLAGLEEHPASEGGSSAEAGAGDGHGGEPDAQGDSAGGLDGGDTSGPCPADMVVNGTSCIDRTEVTTGDYQLVMLNADAAALPPRCRPWKTAFNPGTTRRGQLPAGDLDWCDAYVYCALKMKRLCGSVLDGGALRDPSAAVSNTVSEWGHACGGDEGRAFPYGKVFDPTACNGRQADAGEVVPVGQFAGCEGTIPGVFDLAGNVYEWLNACEPDDAGVASCAVAGGSWQIPMPSTSNNVGCFESYPELVDYYATDIGVRCCADVRR